MSWSAEDKTILHFDMLTVPHPVCSWMSLVGLLCQPNTSIYSSIITFLDLLVTSHLWDNSVAQLFPLLLWQLLPNASLKVFSYILIFWEVISLMTHENISGKCPQINEYFLNMILHSYPIPYSNSFKIKQRGFLLISAGKCSIFFFSYYTQ